MNKQEAEARQRAAALALSLHALAGQIESGEAIVDEWSMTQQLGRSREREKGKEWAEPFPMGRKRLVMTLSYPQIVARLPLDAKPVTSLSGRGDDNQELTEAFEEDEEYDL